MMRKKPKEKWTLMKTGRSTWTVGYYDQGNNFCPEEDFPKFKEANTYLNLRKSLIVVEQIR